MTIKIDYREKQLRTLFSELATTQGFVKMSETVENSPWHREANVLVHTEMVLNEYITLTNNLRGNEEWSEYDFLGGLSCIWHDTGKPHAKTAKHSPERGDYYSFHGHELVSARIFEQYAVSNDMFNHNSNPNANLHVFAVEWMILHHMPWAITSPKKLAELKATCAFIHPDMLTVYVRALLADQYGRIADDQEIKNQNSRNWISQLLDVDDTITPNIDNILSSAPLLILPIGPSGAGKSTLCAEWVEDVSASNINIFSLDSLRHELYDPIDYNSAWQQSVDDNTFQSKANQRFMELVKQNKNLFVDNTNLGLKRRSFYISEARKRGYRIIAVVLLSDINTLLHRQRTRADKSVPTSAVRQQYMSMYVPSIGEVDYIDVI